MKNEAKNILLRWNSNLRASAVDQAYLGGQSGTRNDGFLATMRFHGIIWVLHDQIATGKFIQRPSWDLVDARALEQCGRRNFRLEQSLVENIMANGIAHIWGLLNYEETTESKTARIERKRINKCKMLKFPNASEKRELSHSQKKLDCRKSFILFGERKSIRNSNSSNKQCRSRFAEKKNMRQHQWKENRRENKYIYIYICEYKKYLNWRIDPYRTQRTAWLRSPKKPRNESRIWNFNQSIVNGEKFTIRFLETTKENRRERNSGSLTSL